MAIFDFVAEAAGNERGATLSKENAVAEGVFQFSDQDITLTITSRDTVDDDPVSYPYLDDLLFGRPGGLGVTADLNSEGEAKPSSDDNITQGETLFWEFDQPVTITDLSFSDVLHYVPGQPESNFQDDEFFEIIVDGDADNPVKVFFNEGLTEPLVGTNFQIDYVNEQFYIRTATVEKTAGLGDKVFVDSDGDGIQDDNEPGISGATVKLLDTNGGTVATTITDANGFYSFENLAADDYKVMFVKPQGFDAASPFQSGDNDATDSDADPNNGLMSNIVNLSPGEFDSTIDAGFFELGSIGDKVFNDLDEDGIQDDNEPGIPGAEVKLIDSDGNVLATDITNSNGMYAFAHLVPGDYKVMFVQPNGFDGVSPVNVGSNDAIDSDANPDNGLMSDVITITSGEKDKTVDGGFFKPEPKAGLGNFVFNDLDSDGIQDDNEPGIAGATVKLQDEDGNVLNTTTTNDDGFYQFTDLDAGDYKVMFVQPNGFDFVSPFQVGSNDAIDSNANPNNGLMSDVVNLSPGEFDSTIDAGFYKGASLGDFVFNDLDRNGIQDDNEPGIAGAEVKLQDANGNVLTTTTTNDDGFYQFTGLDTGDYKVMFVQPSGLDGVSPVNVGDNDAVDSDADPNNGLMSDVVSLSAGENNNTIDAGFFDKPDPTAKLGNFVFQDLNANGTQDANEPGIAGATVKLQDENGNVLNTTTTDDDGFYLFDNLEAGDYKVMFVQPNGFDFVSPFQVGINEAIDSDANPDNGLMSNVVSLDDGEFNPTIDAGFYKGASLGDFVFNDLDQDGIQDDNEPGIAGAEVKLQDADGNVLDTTTTNDDGFYQFTGLNVGDYKVMFSQPTGFQGVSPFEAGDDAVDSNANPNNGLMSDVVSLSAGENNDTIDAGFFEFNSEIDLQKFVRVDPNPNPVEPEPDSPLVGGGVAGQDVCETEGKVESLLFEYDPSSMVSTAQDDEKARIISSGGTDDDGVSYVVVTDEKEASKALSGEGDRFFAGNVEVGETFEASKGDDKFGSKTFIYFFDDASGGLLQSVEYHTSCSQPIRLGDVIGNATLVGYDGEDGSLITLPAEDHDSDDSDNNGEIMLEVDSNFATNNIGVDADSPTGPIAELNEKITFTYQVTNTGNTSLEITELVDDNETSDTSDDFTPAAVTKDNGSNFGDTNNNSLLDADEVWYYQAMKIATETGQRTNDAEVVAEDDFGNTVSDQDPANYLVNPIALKKLVAVESNNQGGQDLCEAEGDPETLVFEYDPSSTVSTAQDSKKASIISSGGTDDDGVSYVVVTDEKEASKALSGEGDRFFAGNVAVGETFAATTTEDDFGSETFIYFFDDASGGLLQSVNYHTSCSQPIRLGDVVGNATLVGYDGEDGGMVELQSQFADANTAPGLEAVIGSEVEFRYEVTNVGDTALTNINLTDDRLDSVSFVSGDKDGDNQLDADETWIYSASETAASGLQTNTGTVTGKLNGQTVTATDPANYTGIVRQAPSGDICDIYGKPLELTFEYDPGTEVATGQDQGKAMASGTPDTDGESFIVVSSEKKVSDLFDSDSKIFFKGNVSVGEEFTADADNSDKGKFGSETTFYIFDDQGAFSAGANPLQTLKYHTSCSQPIQIGDTIGSVELVGYVGEDGSFV